MIERCSSLMGKKGMLWRILSQKLFIRVRIAPKTVKTDARTRNTEDGLVGLKAELGRVPALMRRSIWRGRND